MAEKTFHKEKFPCPPNNEFFDWGRLRQDTFKQSIANILSTNFRSKICLRAMIISHKMTICREFHCRFPSVFLIRLYRISTLHSDHHTSVKSRLFRFPSILSSSSLKTLNYHCRLNQLSAKSLQNDGRKLCFLNDKVT